MERAGDSRKDSVAEGSSTAWVASGLLSNTGRGISGDRTVPVGSCQLSDRADYLPHLPPTALPPQQTDWGYTACEAEQLTLSETQGRKDPLPASCLLHEVSSAQD